VNLPRHCQYATKSPRKFSDGYLASKFKRLNFKHSLKLSLGLATTVLLCWENAGVFAISPKQQVIESFPVSQTGSTMTQLFVNPTAGNDSTGNGSDRTPFKSITQALKVAKENTVIYLAPGTYSEQNGETFPLELKAGVTLQGDPSTKGRDVIIRGGGSFLSPTFARQNAAILAVNKSGIAGVTVTNPNTRGYGIWIESSSAVIADNTLIGNSHDGISIAGNSAPLIRNNYFANNGANGMTIYGSSRPEVRENVFEKTGFAINIGHNATPLIAGNRISQNTDGIVIQGKARPILRGNTIESNSRDGVVALTETLPDLGSAQDPAGNIFRNNGRYEINAATAVQVIPVYGNQLATRRLVGRISLDGNLIQVTAPRNSSPNVDGTGVRISVPTPAARPQPRRNTRRRTTTRRRRVSRPVRRPSATTRKNSPQASTTSVAIPVPPPQRTGLPQTGIQAGALPTANPAFAQVNTNTVLPNNQMVSALNSRYRVLVEVRTLDEQTRLLSLVPEASRTVLSGKVVMDAGLFSDRTQADQMLEKINSNGLLGTIEEVN
jgi:parallel beta-helix repeat protein